MPDFIVDLLFAVRGAESVGSGTSGVGGKGVFELPHRKDHRSVGAFGHEFALYGVPRDNDAGRYDCDEFVDAEDKNLLGMP